MSSLMKKLWYQKQHYLKKIVNKTTFRKVQAKRNRKHSEKLDGEVATPLPKCHLQKKLY